MESALNSTKVVPLVHQWLKFLLILLMGVSVAGLTACSTPKKNEVADLVWPPPPEKPRIKFLAAYHGDSDLGNAPSLLDRALGGDFAKGLSLSKPYGITATDDGKRIYVTDTVQRMVIVFDLEQKKVYPFQVDATGALLSPIEVRLDETGRVYITDSMRGSLNIYSPEGKTLMSLGNEQGLKRPTGLALDKKRKRVYVSDTYAHRIFVFDYGGKLINEIGERGSDPEQFNYPTNIALDAEGNLYITDSGNFRVQVYSADGEFVRVFGQMGDSFGSFARPKGVAVDSDNNVYVVDAAFNNFQIFNDKDRILLFVGTLGRTLGRFWIPTSIYIDSSDRIYVVDSINARVQVFQYIKHEDEVESGQ